MPLMAGPVPAAAVQAGASQAAVLAHWRRHEEPAPGSADPLERQVLAAAVQQGGWQMGWGSEPRSEPAGKGHRLLGWPGWSPGWGSVGGWRGVGGLQQGSPEEQLPQGAVQLTGPSRLPGAGGGQPAAAWRAAAAGLVHWALPALRSACRGLQALWALAWALGLLDGGFWGARGGQGLVGHLHPVMRGAVRLLEVQELWKWGTAQAWQGSEGQEQQGSQAPECLQPADCLQWQLGLVVAQGVVQGLKTRQCQAQALLTAGWPGMGGLLLEGVQGGQKVVCWAR